MTPILTLEHINKQYPGVKALDDLDFTLERGEVRALLGKNGAGKSTLVKILSGAVQPDSGTIHIDGQPVSFHSPPDAFAKGYCHRVPGDEPGARADRSREHPAWQVAPTAFSGHALYRSQRNQRHRQSRAGSARGQNRPERTSGSPQCRAAATCRDCQGDLLRPEGDGSRRANQRSSCRGSRDATPGRARLWRPRAGRSST